MPSEKMPTDTTENVRAFLDKDPRHRIILALDHVTINEMLSIDSKIFSTVGLIKIGNELHSRHGWAAISSYLSSRRSVKGLYYDARFSDNPDQTGALLDVFNSNRPKDSISPGIVSLDVLGASDAALEQAARRRGKFLLITETVQASLDESDCRKRHRRSIREVVYDAATIAEESGLQGTTSSVEGLPLITEDTALSGLLRVVSGIRLTGEARGDQKVVATPSEAIKRGAEMLVIGRSILNAPNNDQYGQMQRIAEDICKEV